MYFFVYCYVYQIHLNGDEFTCCCAYCSACMRWCIHLDIQHLQTTKLNIMIQYSTVICDSHL